MAHINTRVIIRPPLQNWVERHCFNGASVLTFSLPGALRNRPGRTLNVRANPPIKGCYAYMMHLLSAPAVYCSNYTLGVAARMMSSFACRM